MKYPGIISAIVVLSLSPFFLASCEETVSSDEFELPYKEELVVQGFLTLGTEGDTVEITRTLPTFDRWSIEKAAVTDAEVTLSGEGTTWQLHHLGLGRYAASEEIDIRADQDYTLHIRSGEKVVEATAHIPQAPVIYGTRFDTIPDGCTYGIGDSLVSADAVNLMLRFLQRQNRIYRYQVTTVFRINDSTRYYMGMSPDRIRGRSEEDREWEAVLNERCLSDFINTEEIDSVYLQLYEYEEAYTDYFRTNRRRDGDLFFGPDGRQPLWNVTGDGFGWFFGRSFIRDTITSF